MKTQDHNPKKQSSLSHHWPSDQFRPTSPNRAAANRFTFPTSFSSPFLLRVWIEAAAIALPLVLLLLSIFECSIVLAPLALQKLLLKLLIRLQQLKQLVLRTDWGSFGAQVMSHRFRGMSHFRTVCAEIGVPFCLFCRFQRFDFTSLTSGFRPLFHFPRPPVSFVSKKGSSAFFFKSLSLWCVLLSWWR